jgi:protein TonB
MDTVPLYRIPPQYPLHAKRRGLEGWVDLEFSISKTGRVVEPVVLRADPLGVFDQAARAAVIKWRYRPKFDQGTAVEREGLSVRIWFELQDE